jgi:hypothetical protein
MKLDPATTTLETTERVRAELHHAFLESCVVVSRVYHGLMTPGEAATRLKEILAPLQIEEKPKTEGEA